MAIFELFSSRQKKARGDVPDVYQYDDIPNKLRVQIIHIVKATIGTRENTTPYGGPTICEQVYQKIHQILCKEYGVFSLANKNYSSDFESVYEFFLKTDKFEECLDIIELTFKVIRNYVKPNQGQFEREAGIQQKADDAINELNQRFKETGVGYEFVSGEIVKIDSQFIHSEIVKPALSILQEDEAFAGARDEFLSAHAHYRNQRYKEALVDCLKSFESLMKAICQKHGWSFGKNDTAKKLINICLTNNLIPSYMQEQFSQFRALLESGVPTVRNKEGGHGQGSEIKNVSATMVSYTLHLTATNIVFLGSCDKES
ncbi:STM4504/CBY_0614 family protein [Celerinatantimonas sp. YJH-8]|uniref:STM4504/CBY_0614 family protein n=1 Tax=Celerinatantimonas sp. YJH-8 TaxID=3228714 RepID=UPI0038CAF86D